MSDIEGHQPKGGQGQVIEAETFRDSVGTMDNTGKRKWVFPKIPSGRYTNYRNIVAILLLFTFFALPFIKINGNPLFLINIIIIFCFFFPTPMGHI
jgi:hypothetical protein